MHLGHFCRPIKVSVARAEELHQVLPLALGTRGAEAAPRSFGSARIVARSATLRSSRTSPGCNLSGGRRQALPP